MFQVKKEFQEYHNSFFLEKTRSMLKSNLNICPVILALILLCILPCKSENIIEKYSKGRLPIEMAINLLKADCNQVLKFKSVYRLPFNSSVYYFIETEDLETKFLECKELMVSFQKTNLNPIIEEGSLPPMSIQNIGTGQYPPVSGKLSPL